MKVIAKLTVNEELLTKVRTRLSDKRKKLKKQHRFSVGITAEKGSAKAKNYKGAETNVTVAQVAAFNEFGTDTVPERPAMRAWFDQNVNRLKSEARAVTRLELEGNEGVVEQQAAKWADDLREWVASGNAGLAELQPSTMDQREAAGLSPAPPLDATGQLLEAIGFTIEDA